MSGHVNLDNDLHAALLGKVEHLGKVFGSVGETLGIRTAGRKVGERRDLERPGLRVGDVEVEAVHLIPCERIDGAEDVLLGVPLPGDIEVETAVLELWLVEDPDGGEGRVHAVVFVLVGGVEELGEGVESVQDTEGGGRSDVGAVASVGDREVVALVRTVFSGGGGLRGGLRDDDVLELGAVGVGGLEVVAALVELPGDEVVAEEGRFCAAPGVIDFIGGFLGVLILVVSMWGLL